MQSVVHALLHITHSILSMPLFRSKRSNRRDEPSNTVTASDWAPQPSYPTMDFGQFNQPPTREPPVTSRRMGSLGNSQNYNYNGIDNGAGLWQGLPNASPPRVQHPQEPPARSNAYPEFGQGWQLGGSSPRTPRTTGRQSGSASNNAYGNGQTSSSNQPPAPQYPEGYVQWRDLNMQPMTTHHGNTTYPRPSNEFPDLSSIDINSESEDRSDDDSMMFVAPIDTGYVNPTRDASGHRSSRPRALSTGIAPPQIPRVQPQNTSNNFGDTSDPMTPNTSFPSNTYGRNTMEQSNQPYNTTPPRNGPSALQMNAQGDGEGRNSRGSGSQSHSNSHTSRFSRESMKDGSLGSSTLRWFRRHLEDETPMALATTKSFVAIGTCGRRGLKGYTMVLNTTTNERDSSSSRDGITHLELHSIHNPYFPTRGQKTWLIAAEVGCVFIKLLDESVNRDPRDFPDILDKHSSISCLTPIPGQPFAATVSKGRTPSQIKVHILDLEHVTIYHNFELDGPFTSLDVYGKRLAICAGQKCQIWDWYGKKLIDSIQIDNMECVSFMDETHVLLATQRDEIKLYSISSGKFTFKRDFQQLGTIPGQIGKPGIISLKAIQNVGVCRYGLDIGSRYSESSKGKTMIAFYDLYSGTLMGARDTNNSTIFGLLPNDNLELLHQDNSSSLIQVVDLYSGTTISTLEPGSSIYHIGYYRDHITILSGRAEKSVVTIYQFIASTREWEIVRRPEEA